MKNLSFCLAVLLFSFAAGAQTPPLGAANDFAVLSAADVVSTENVTVSGDVGGAYSVDLPMGQPDPGEIRTDLTDAFDDANAIWNSFGAVSCDYVMTGLDLEGTILPGTYCWGGDANWDDDVVFDGGPTDEWLFLAGGPTGGAFYSTAGADWSFPSGGSSCQIRFGAANWIDFGAGNTLGTLVAPAVSVASTHWGHLFAINGNVSLSGSADIEVEDCPETPPPTLVCEPGIDETADAVTTYTSTEHFTIETTIITRVITH